MVNELMMFVRRNRLFILLLAAGVFGEIIFFYYFPKQSWIDGLMESWYMFKGLVIYKDFSSEYPPILFMLMVPLHKIFGFIQSPTILLAPINSIFLFILVAFVSIKWLRGWFRLIPLLFFLLWDPILGENHFATTSFQNTLNFIVFILWWSWYGKPKKSTAFFLGLFLSVSLLSAQTVALFVMVIFASFIFKSFRERHHLNSLVVFVVTFLVPIVSVLLWLAASGALPAFYYWNFTYYLSANYPYAMGRDMGNILMFLAVFSPVVLVGEIVYLYFRQMDRSYSLSRYVFWLLILLSFPVPFWFALFHPNRFLMSVTIFALSLGLGMQTLAQVGNKMRRVNWLLIGLIIVLSLTSFFKVILPKYQWGFSYPRQHNILTKTYEDDPMFQVTKWVRENTPLNAKLFAMTDSLIYLETDRLPINSRATTNLPFVYRPLKYFGWELKRQPPDYWVIDERGWRRFHDFNSDDVTIFLQKILVCEPIVAQMEYVTIRKHISGTELCL